MIFTHFESDFHSIRVVLTLFTLLKSNHFTLFTLRECGTLQTISLKAELVLLYETYNAFYPGGTGKARFNVATPTNATVTCTAYVLPYNFQTKSI